MGDQAPRVLYVKINGGQTFVIIDKSPAFADTKEIDNVASRYITDTDAGENTYTHNDDNSGNNHEQDGSEVAEVQKVCGGSEVAEVPFIESRGLFTNR